MTLNLTEPTTYLHGAMFNPERFATDRTKSMVYQNHPTKLRTCQMQESSSTVNTKCFAKTNHFFHIRSRNVIGCWLCTNIMYFLWQMILLNTPLATEIRKNETTLPGWHSLWDAVAE